jgi:Flp pilus assembly protein TadB
VKLSDDEERELGRLERALRAEDPGLDRRLAQMRPGGLGSLHAVLALSAGVALGAALVTVGDLLGGTACLVAGLILIATVPALAVLWWARRYYCRCCAGKWPAPARSCPRCARPTPA